jgi:ABC-2 type transport system ATP-binding protein
LLRSARVSALPEETQALVIDLVEGAEAVAQRLSERGFEHEHAVSRIVLPDAGPDAYDAVRDAIVDAGAILYRLAPERLALADIFAAPADHADEAPA